MLWFVCFFNYADRQAIYSVFPKLKEEFGFDKAQLGLIASAFMWVYAGGAPFAGFICDRFRRKDLILGGCLFWSFVTITTGWCQKLWHFVTVRALEGFGETFYFPASLSLVSDYHDRAHPVPRAVVSPVQRVHRHHSGKLAGRVVRRTYRLADGFLFLRRRWAWCWRWCSTGSCANRRAVKPRRPAAISASHGIAGEDRLSVAETLRVIFRTPVAPLLMLAFVGANFVATIFLTWTPTFLVEKFHFKLSSAGLSGAIFIHLASACSVPVAGWLADRLTLRFAGGRMLVQAGGPAGRRRVCVPGRADRQRQHPVAGDDDVRALQGPLRLGHFCFALRRRRTARARHCRRHHEHGRLGRRRAWPGIRRAGVEIRTRTHRSAEHEQCYRLWRVVLFGLRGVARRGRALAVETRSRRSRGHRKTAGLNEATTNEPPSRRHETTPGGCARADRCAFLLGRRGGFKRGVGPWPGGGDVPSRFRRAAKKSGDDAG